MEKNNTSRHSQSYKKPAPQPPTSDTGVLPPPPQPSWRGRGVGFHVSHGFVVSLWSLAIRTGLPRVYSFVWKTNLNKCVRQTVEEREGDSRETGELLVAGDNGKEEEEGGEAAPSLACLHVQPQNDDDDEQASRRRSNASPEVRVEAEAVLLVVFFVVCVPASAILHPVDYLELQSIRKTLADLPGSAFFASWDFTADPCAFAGVVCSGDRVVALSLGDPRAGSPGLSGSLPSSLARLSALEELSLVPGRVAGSLPAALPQGLRFLALASNRISGPLPHSLAALRGIRTLDLSSNLLSGNIPTALLRLPELRTLILAHNRLSGPVPASVSAPLLRLDLRSNVLTGSVRSLPPSLIYLSLASNRLSGHVDRVLPRLNRLSFLDLSANRLSGPIPGILFTFPISSLQLQRNQFSGPLRPGGPLPVSGATVDLSYNRFTGKVPAELAPAGRLYLDFNRFEGDVPAAIVDRVVAGSMRVLYLHHNYLTGFRIRTAASVPAATSLCLQYNCMVPPVDALCPRNAGPRTTRPPQQCAGEGKQG
ncbi:hypothetical protein OPV22_004842 [Ensete ventricosum]|uniref:Leucine-rich repeat-containing N-terminal plant-type domain-containing protein n=1 Tax=Ensete ventricosum TaxID=4639 RepID=A0AAV8RN86_ENSVE|nr:hypothetical protein OPV22_004842 [Ensete ventricosum]